MKTTRQRKKEVISMGIRQWWWAKLDRDGWKPKL